MTLEECYAQMGGDYQGTLRRLCSERLIQRVILKFPGDPSYGELSRTMKEGQWEDAFRAAHTLKGVSQNLGMTALYEPTAELTELLRGGKNPGATDLMTKIDAAYERTIAAIQRLQESNLL